MEAMHFSTDSFTTRLADEVSPSSSVFWELTCSSRKSISAWVVLQALSHDLENKMVLTQNRNSSDSGKLYPNTQRLQLSEGCPIVGYLSFSLRVSLVWASVWVLCCLCVVTAHSVHIHSLHSLQYICRKCQQWVWKHVKSVPSSVKKITVFIAMKLCKVVRTKI